MQEVGYQGIEAAELVMQQRRHHRQGANSQGDPFGPAQPVDMTDGTHDSLAFNRSGLKNKPNRLNFTLDDSPIIRNMILDRRAYLLYLVGNDRLRNENFLAISSSYNQPENLLPASVKNGAELLPRRASMFGALRS
jgi:hypothetical protein